MTICVSECVSGWERERLYVCVWFLVRLCIEMKHGRTQGSGLYVKVTLIWYVLCLSLSPLPADHWSRGGKERQEINTVNEHPPRTHCIHTKFNPSSSPFSQLSLYFCRLSLSLFFSLAHTLSVYSSVYVFWYILLYCIYIYYAIVVVVEFVIANKSLFTTKMYTLFFCE